MHGQHVLSLWTITAVTVAEVENQAYSSCCWAAHFSLEKRGGTVVSPFSWKQRHRGFQGQATSRAEPAAQPPGAILPSPTAAPRPTNRAVMWKPLCPPDPGKSHQGPPVKQVSLLLHHIHWRESRRKGKVRWGPNSCIWGLWGSHLLMWCDHTDV